MRRVSAGWTPDTESHEEQEAHWAAVTEMWERVGQKNREAARAHRGPRLTDQGIRGVDSESRALLITGFGWR